MAEVYGIESFRPAPVSGEAERVVVTGGAGFVGSHLCRALLARGAEVVCLDDLSTGSADNIADLTRNRRFTFIRHDVIEPYEALIASCNAIYNLACPASPVHYQADRVRTALVNAQGMLNALRLAARDKARLLQASTSEVYGDPEVHPQTEAYRGSVNPIGPRSCYDEGKRFAETLATDFAAQAGIEVRIARIFNTYGPRMQRDDGRVVSNLIVQALQGEELTVYGDGAQTRSFCYVEDTVEGLMRLMKVKAVSGPVNIGNPEEFTIERLARLILMMTGSRAALTFRPLPIDDPRRRKPDISRAMSELGWRPRVKLARGLRDTIKDFSQRLSLRAEDDDVAAAHEAPLTPRTPPTGGWSEPLRV